MPVKCSIKLMKGIALLLFCFFCHFSLTAQCFDDFKKEGDRYNQNTIYEQAITKYLAALLCPDLEQDQRIQLINLIKGALQARKDQLQSALSTVVDNVLKSAEEDILNLEYAAALEKIKNAILPQVDERKVGLAMMELVYFFNESGQYERAISLSDTLRSLLKIERVAIQQDTMNAIRDYLAKANAERYQQLETRYYPIMIAIPGGTFEMGCNSEIDKDCSDSETPYQVKLSTYRLAQYETTNWQYHLYSVSSGQDSIERTREAWPLQGDLPVVNVRWYDGVQYANWLSHQKGFAKSYIIDKENRDTNNTNSYDDLQWIVNLAKNGQGYRLPTEAEWEYAAQGGVAKKETIYSGSDNLDEVGWYGSNSNSRPHPVGTLQANRLGLFDMSGNVWEWCWDWYGDYATETAENPLGAATGNRRVLRGGSWFNFVNYCRVSYRYDKAL